MLDEFSVKTEVEELMRSCSKAQGITSDQLTTIQN